MWMELYSRDPALLEQFEGFLTNVVTDLERSQSDVEHVQNKIKKLVRLQLNNIYIVLIVYNMHLLMYS